MSAAASGAGARPRRSAPARCRMLVWAVAVLVVLAGCSYNSPTADTPSLPSDFTFVAPGGQTRIFYDPPAQRGMVRGLSGESLLEPGRTIGLADFPG